MPTKKHEFNLDLIRMVAVVCVLSVHFFLNSGFYDTPVEGRAMVFGTILRTFLMVCVPLFLLLTGYLKGAHRWTPAYWKGLGKLLLSYLLAALFCLTFRALYLGDARTPLDWVLQIFDFSAAPYAWYIEMYLGVFLLIPFLNTLWVHLPSDRARRALVLTLIALSILPSLDSATAVVHLRLLPDWWDRLYPLTYYYVGLSIREHPPQWNRGLCLLVSLLSAMVGGSAHAYFAHAHGNPISFVPINYWNGLFPFVSAVFLFLALRKENGRMPPAPVRWAVGKVASLSLPIFLVSWIPDQVVYGHLKQAVTAMPDRIPYILLTVPLVLVSATILAQVLTWVQNLLTRLWRRDRVKTS